MGGELKLNSDGFDGGYLGIEDGKFLQYLKRYARRQDFDSTKRRVFKLRLRTTTLWRSRRATWRSWRHSIVHMSICTEDTETPTAGDSD